MNIITQYRIRYIISRDDNRDIHTIICNNRYELQIHINEIVSRRNEGYEFIGIDDRVINPNYNVDENYGWNKIFNF